MSEPLALTATKARERYERDARFHAIAQSIVAYVLQEHGRVNPERADREADDIATKVAAMVIERMFAEDQELAAQRAIAERYRQVAEDALLAFNRPPLFIASASDPSGAQGEARASSSTQDELLLPKLTKAEAKRLLKETG